MRGEGFWEFIDKADPKLTVKHHITFSRDKLYSWFISMRYLWSVLYNAALNYTELGKRCNFVRVW